jgi:hypothetical protein
LLMFRHISTSRLYKLDSFVGFIGDEQVHAQECYEGWMANWQQFLGH